MPVPEQINDAADPEFFAEIFKQMVNQAPAELLQEFAVTQAARQFVHDVVASRSMPPPEVMAKVLYEGANPEQREAIGELLTSLREQLMEEEKEKKAGGA